MTTTSRAGTPPPRATLCCVWRRGRSRAYGRCLILLHLQSAYEHLDLAEGAFPVAEAKAKQIVSLPIYPELTEAQQDHVVATLRAYVDRFGD